MAIDIKRYIDNIKNAIWAKDVRDDIANAFDVVESSVNTVDSELKKMLKEIDNIGTEVVSALPDENIKERTVYFLKMFEGTSSFRYDLYMYVNDNFLKIGTTDNYLSNYVLKTTTVADLPLSGNIDSRDLTEKVVNKISEESIFKSDIGTGLISNTTFINGLASNSIFNSRFASTFASTFASNSTFGQYFASNNSTFARGFACNADFARGFAAFIPSYVGMFVPTPSAGDAGRVLKAVGTNSVSWVDPS